MALVNLTGPLQNDTTGQAGNATLVSILAALNTLVGDTDDIESLLTTIRDNADQVEALLTALGVNTDQIETLLTATNLLLTAIGSNTDGIEALVTASNALLTTIRDNADTVEALLAAIGNNTDGIEGLIGTTNTLLTALGTNTDGIEGLITATNALLTTIRDNADTVEALLTALGTNTDNIETLIGSTNTLLTAIQGFVDGIEGLLAALTNGTQKTQVVDGGGSVLDITAAGAAMCHLDGNAHLADVAAWTPFVDSLVMVGGLVAGSSFSAALSVRAGSRALLIEWVNGAGVAYGTPGNPVNVTGTVATAGLTDAQLRASPVPVDQANTADADYDTGGGVVNQAMMGLALPGAGGPVAGGTAAAPVRTDPTGTTTQPISAAALPLPAGASTSANQATQIANQVTELASLASIDTSTKVAPSFTADSLVLGASTATQLPNVPARRVLVMAERTPNTAVVRIKQANTVSATSGFALDPGKGIVMAVDNLNDVWAFTTGTGHRVSYAVLP